MSTRAWFGWMVKKPISIRSGATHTATMPTTSSTTPSVCVPVVMGASSGGSMVAPTTISAIHRAVTTSMSASIGQPLLAWTVFSTDMMFPFSLRLCAPCARPFLLRKEVIRI